MNDGTTRHWRYVPALDGVRAVAVALVVLAHSYEMLLWRQSSLFAQNSSLFAQNWSPVPGGAFGVDMFFALSGFLITALLFTEFQQTGRIDFRAFYIRRALRLLPALVAVLVATSIYAAVTGYAAHRQVQSVFGSLFYFANWMQILHIPHVAAAPAHMVLVGGGAVLHRVAGDRGVVVASGRSARSRGWWARSCASRSPIGSMCCSAASPIFCCTSAHSPAPIRC